jgi:hypothetical protein
LSSHLRTPQQLRLLQRHRTPSVDHGLNDAVHPQPEQQACSVEKNQTSVSCYFRHPQQLRLLQRYWASTQITPICNKLADFAQHQISSCSHLRTPQQLRLLQRDWASPSDHGLNDAVHVTHKVVKHHLAAHNVKALACLQPAEITRYKFGYKVLGA